MKKIVLSADEILIEAARTKAREENTSLNEQFQIWLESYVGGKLRADSAMTTIKKLQYNYSTNGQKFTRDEMNERR